VSDRADFSNLITDVQELPAQLGKLSIKLPVGDYYWRAASWNQAEGYGPYSDVQSFRVEATSASEPEPQQDPEPAAESATGQAG
ncbi:MAG: hypothetical protein HQL47_10005, partial [Gammaproteobacteria bacterium]|nr:hypothetical protein [Gammaproteobacteria bacterium]